MSELLQTKLLPPVLRAPIVERPELLARLDHGLDRRLTLVSAPAGFGKTTLVSLWAAAHQRRHDLPIAWISLDTGDNDPVRFWRYIVAACQTCGAQIGTSARALLRDGSIPSLDLLLTLLINDLSAHAGRFVLVLEAYHTISEPQIQQGIAFLLDHQSPAFHLIILTRSDPPLPLGRLRANGDLAELRAADLRFTTDESQAFLARAFPQPLPLELVYMLQQRSEGWPAGLRLAALALPAHQGQLAVERFLASFGGSHRHIVEYLVADVLDAQPKEIQHFLLQTSIFARLSASLCDAAMERHDSAALLEQLERANLFLTPLDPQRSWHHYHSLFAEAMHHEARQRLGVAQLQLVQRRASYWYERHGLTSEAIEAALAAEDWARAAELVEGLLHQAGANGELQTFYRWGKQLPIEMIYTHPAFCFQYALGMLFLEDRRNHHVLLQISPLLRAAEEAWRAAGDQPRLAEALAFRSMLAWWRDDYEEAFPVARQALSLLPADSHLWRGSCLIATGAEALFEGRLDDAQEQMLAARGHCEASGNRYSVRAADLMLAGIALQRGQLQLGWRLYEQVGADDLNDAADQGFVQVALAGLAYERNDRTAVERYLTTAQTIAAQHAEAIGPQYAEESFLVPALLLQAQLTAAYGDLARARQMLQDLLPRLDRPGVDRLRRRVRAEQARMALAAGDLAAVQLWAMSSSQRSDRLPIEQQEREALIVARLLITQGEGRAALQALERWHEQAQMQGRVRSELEILLISALGHLASGEQARAQQLCGEVIGRAQPERYIRLFLDEGEPGRTLLQITLPALPDQHRPYAAELLSLFTEHRPAPAPPRPQEQLNPRLNPELSDLIEPLSPHEQRVLRLLAAGSSNPDIAEELIVSVNTIKTQVQSIYRKLNVSSRREARQMARELDLV
jgi:LuxR family transcriptional regulator, maltose regulon positive regulatory protein